MKRPLLLCALALLLCVNAVSLDKHHKHHKHRRHLRLREHRHHHRVGITCQEFDQGDVGCRANSPAQMLKQDSVGLDCTQDSGQDTSCETLCCQDASSTTSSSSPTTTTTTTSSGSMTCADFNTDIMCTAVQMATNPDQVSALCTADSGSPTSCETVCCQAMSIPPPTPAVQPASALVSLLTRDPHRPVDYPPLLPVSGDGLCYWTMPYTPDGYGVVGTARAYQLRDAPCGNIIATIPVSTELTPLYASQYSSSCTLVSQTSCAAQCAAAEAAGRHCGSCVHSYTFNWWLQVQYGTQQGWIENGLVIKKRCNDPRLPDATCSYTPNTPHQCYRATGGATIVDAPCSRTVVIRAPIESILVSVDDQPAQPCTNDATKSYFHVTLDGQSGYVLNHGLLNFGCNGDGWLTQVGPYPVIKIDHTVGDGLSHCSAGSHCGRQQETPSKFLLHTTDGRWPTWGDYPATSLDAPAWWPHFLLARDSTGVITLAQFFSMYSTSRALEDGNDQGVVQVEIGARGEIPFTEHDQELTAAVRALYQAISDYTGIPICKDSRINFIAGFGHASERGGPQRPSSAVFDSINGLCGHGNAHGNSHWDPGVIDPWKLIL